MTGLEQDTYQFETDEGKIQYATFRLEGEFFGVDVLRVQEILLGQEMTPVPLAPDYVSGLINLRGQIVTAIDLGRRLTNRPDAASSDSNNLVVNTGDGTVSLLVDEIGDVIEVDKHLMAPVPPTIKSIHIEYLKGVCKLDDELLMVLDVERILDNRQE
ncbi:MAG TPA: chemotaxis protein CheW [Bacteroidetes bacterium]|nr:chemotaxis protein CheW [Bacteroidota bacterium]